MKSLRSLGSLLRSAGLSLLLLAAARPLPAQPEAWPPVPADRIRFSFHNTSQGPARQEPAFLTITGRDSQGRFCRLDRFGRFLPCTAADNQILRNGTTWADYSLPLAEVPFLDIDRQLQVDSGRAYLTFGERLFLRVDEATGGLVQPDPNNPQCPNRHTIYDWIEFALDRTGFHGNTTCVDQFGLPVSLEVRPRDPRAAVLGPVGVVASRAALFQAWRRTVPPIFQALEEPDGTRILAPAHGQAAATARAAYLDTYIADMWRKYALEPLVLTPDEGTFTGWVDPAGRIVFHRPDDPAAYVIQGRPSSLEVFRCDGVLAQGNGLEKVLGAQLAALLNRHLLETPLNWRSASQYYRACPNNHYARFWHQHSLGRKAYGFAYDDVNDQSPSLATADPMEIRVAFRLD